MNQLSADLAPGARDSFIRRARRFFYRHRVMNLATALAIGAVVAALIGDRQVNGGVVWLDSLYRALTTLALGSDSLPEGSSTPTMLHIGRFLGVAFMLAAIFGALLRAGVIGLDRGRLRRFDDHALVIGSGENAVRIAEVWKHAPPHGCRSDRVFLVGDVPDDRASELRSRGIRVAPFPNDKDLSQALGGAREVMIVEEDDVVGLQQLSRIQSVLLAAPPTDPVHLEVVLHDADLARSYRNMRRDRRRPQLRYGVLSVSEALAVLLSRRIERDDSGRWPAAVVIGRGEFARELATSAVQRVQSPGESFDLHLIASPGDDWHVSIAPELESGPTEGEVRIHTHSQALDPVAVDEVLTEIESHQKRGITVLVIGLDDIEALALGAFISASRPPVEVRATSTASGSSVEGDPTWHPVVHVGVERDPHDSGSPRALSDEPNWSRVVVGDALVSAEVLDAARLARELETHHARICLRIGAEASPLRIFAPAGTDVGDRPASWALDLSAAIFEQLDTAGFELWWTRGRVVVDFERLPAGALRRCVRRALDDAALHVDATPSDADLKACARDLTVALPDRLARIGCALRQSDEMVSR